MENKLRRGLALLMTLIMLISCAPMDALAAIVPVSGGTQNSEGLSLLSIVKPPVATHTYIFMNDFMNGDNKEFARQIVKNGETLNNPGTPDAGSPNKEFTGWRDGAGNAPVFGAVTVNENDTKTITYHAQFDDVYFVFFTNPSGEVMVTKKGANGEKIFTDGVTYPVGNEQSIIGWNYTGNEDDPLISEVKLEGKDVTLKAVVKDGHWITYDSQGGTYVEPAFVKANEGTTAPTNPTRPGYTFAHWSETKGGAAFTFGQRLDKSPTLYAVWTPNTRTQYTVIHWQENADDDDYSFAESEPQYGTTGAQTSAAAKSYTGFNAQDITQQTIAGDGSTIVNVYYKRNTYTITFYLDDPIYNCGKEEHTHSRRNGCYDWRGNLICTKEEHTHNSACDKITQITINAKYDANISDQWPTVNGSSTWRTSQNGTTYQVNIDTMPLNGAKFYGPKTDSSSESAHYYVEVLPGETGETISGRTYKLHHTDTSPGTGYTVSVEDQYPITGFTFNEDISTKIKGKYNNAKFYYTRNSYNIVYVSGGQTVHTVSKKYEQSIADEGSYTPTTKPEGKEAYEFGGWYSDPTTTQAYSFTGKTMPAQNVTVYAKWNLPIVNGKAHIKVDGTDEGTTLTATYGEALNAEELNTLQNAIMDDHPGYTWCGWRTGPNGTGEPFNVDTKIYSNITLYPYYTKDGTFKVEYAVVKDDVTAPVDGKSYAEDSFADLMSPGKLVAADGEYFLGWSDGAATYQPRDKYQIKSNHANERNVITLTAKWGARPAGTTLTYKANGGAGADEVENLDNNATVTTKPANTFSRVGYTFKGWDTDPNGAGSIAPNTQVQVDNNDGANVLYAIWTANTDTKYTVEFYYQNTDGTYTLNHSDERQGTTDTTASVTKVDKADKENGKYVFEADNKDNVLSGIINGAGSLVLKLYFKLNTASYTIHHYLNGTTVKVAEDETGTKTIGETLTANKSGALYAAYAAAVVAGYAPSQTITIAADESENVITVYYTVSLTIKAKDANKTYDGQPLTQPDFTMEGLVNGDTKENFSLSMTAASTITNAGSKDNVIDQKSVKYNKGAIPTYYNVSYANGTLTVNKDSATVTITGVNETHVYDGKQHEANGYNYSFTGKPNEITISLKPNVLAIARRTDVGTTTMGLTKDSFTVTSANYDVTIKAVNDGYVTITPVTDKVTVTVTENGDIVTYDGTEHSVKGYKSITADNALYDVTKSVKATETAAWTAKGKDAGEYPVGIAASDFENTNKNFTNVTFNIVDGVLKINPITAEVIVTVTENGAIVTYDGNEHSVKGYKSMTADNKLYDVTTSVKTTETAAWTAKGTNAGEYPMGVAAGDFENINENFTNVAFKIVDGVLKINPITENTITITANSASKTYDGTPLTDGGFNFTQNVLVEGDTLTAVVVGSQTDVGVGDNVVTSYKVMRGETNVTSSYTFSDSVKGALTVTTRDVTFTGESKSLPYTGGMQSITGITQSGLVEGHKYEGLTYKAEGQNVGSYDGAFSGDVVIKDAQGNDVTKNYNVTKTPGKLTITNASFTVTFTGESDTKVYNGSEQSITGITVDGLKPGHRYEGLTYAAKGTDKGEYVGAFTGTVKILDENNVDVTENYAVTKTPGKLTITAVETEVVVTITGHKDTVTYDGAEHTVTGYDVSISNELYKEADFTFTGSAEVKGTGANTYPMGLKEGDFRNDSKNFANVTFKVIDGELVINKRPVKVTAQKLEYDYDYANPAAHPADNVVRYTVEAANGERGLLAGDALNADVLYDGQSTQTLIGLYQAVAQIAAAKITNANGDVTANYTIEKVDSTLTIKGNDPLDPGKETTSVQTNYTVGDVIEYKITVKNVSRDEATNVVVTDSMAEIQDSVGYTVSEDRHTATIASIPAGGTVLVYARHTVTAEDVENAYAGDANGSLTNVANIKFGDWNKDVEGDHDKLNDTYEYVVRYYWNNYTSVQPHEEKKLTSMVGMEVTEVPAAIDGYTPVSADSKKLTISADQSKNVIEFYYYKNVELTANSKTETYDGTEKQVNGFTVKGENKDQDDQTIAADFSAITVGAKDIDAGEYPANFAENTVGTVDKTGRYIVAAANNGKLVINPVTGQLIIITANSARKTYDGTPLTDNNFTFTQGVLADGDVLTAVVEGSATNVGDEGKNVVKSYAVKRGETDVTKNYTFGNSIDGKLTINPRKVTLTSETASKEYDGKPLTKPVVTVTGDGFVTGEGATYTFTGSQTVVGSSANAFTYTLNEGTNAGNYEVAKTEGMLTVTQNEKAIKVTANSHTWEYDGQAHSDGGYTVEYDGQTYKVAAGETATLTTGDVVKATVEGIVTNVADSADDNNVVTNVTIANRAGDTVNDQYKTITRVNGGLKITRRGDSEDEDKKVKIIAEPNTVGYDGSAHGAKLNAKGEIELGTSYTTARLVDGHYVDETTLDITGSQMNVGVYEEELKPAVKAGATRIVIRDKDGNDVTDNYALTLVNATLTITGDKLIPDKKAEDENIESNYKLGDKIEFTITVKNVSIYDVENVIVTDANAEIQAGDGYTVSADKHTATIAIIAAKSEIRIKALHTVTSDDILAGKVGNVANVEWKDGETTVTKTVDDDTTKLTPPNVTLNVTKTSDWEGKATGAKPELGTKITYTITVKNTGNVPYTKVNFTDLLQNGDATVTGEIPTYGTLPVNEKKSFTVEYIVKEADLLKESINNKVTAEADEIEYTYYEGKTEKTGKAKPKGEAEVTDRTDDAKASTISTKTTTSKPKNEKGYELGETITYEIKVTNDGNLTLTGVEVVDNLEGAEIKAGSGYDVVNGKAVIAELKPGESVTVKVEYVVTEADILAGKVVNDATVTGKGPGTDPEPNEPSTDDPTDEPKATLEIVKAVEGDPKNGTSYALGEKITYTLTVKVGADNNVTVKDIRVTDTLLTKANVDSGAVEIAGGYTLNKNNEIELPDMAPGADDVVITYTYKVQESDLGSGSYGTVHNAATVKGATPDPDPDNPNPKPDDPKDGDDNDTPTSIRLIITAKDNLGIEYDGQPHGKNGYEATGLATGHRITNVTISGSQTNVGRYENELVPDAAEIKDADGKDVTSHYEIKYVRGTLEIIQSQMALKVVANSNSWTYDDAEHSDGGYTVTYGEESYTVNAGESATLSTGDEVTAVITRKVKNVSDTADGNNEIITLTVENESQYASIIQEAGTLTITQRPVQVTVNSKTFTYDAAEHTVADEHGKEYTIETAAENSGLLLGHTESLNVVYDDGTTKTESRKYVGTYTADSERDENGKAVVTITKEDSGEDVTANYAITVKPGTLEIKKAEIEIELIGPKSERVYNGQEQVVETTEITTDEAYAHGAEEPKTIKIVAKGLKGEDYISKGTVIHIAKGTYVGEHPGDFVWDGPHGDDDKPTVLNNDGNGNAVDVTENYTFKTTPGSLTIKSNQLGEHPTQPDKEIDGHEPGTKYALGDRIYFKITVRNITLDTLELVEVYDPTAVIVPGDGYTVVDEHHAKIENMPASVDGQEPATVIINAYHVVTEDDIKNIVIDSGYKYENVATITVGDKTIDASKGTNDIEDADYTLKIEKQLINRPASGEKFKLGETAKFQITVTNEGNVTQTDIPVAEKLPGAVFTEGDGYTLNADKTVATITKVLNPADKETQHGDSIILYAQYTITENDLGNTGLKNIVTAPNGKPGEEPIPVDEAKSMAGQKIWNDLDNLYDTRTESVTVNLMRSLGRGGAAELIRTVTVTQNSGWRYSFDHLPAHDMQDNEYFYWVEEEPITGYETVYEMSDDSHCDIVNNLQTYTLTIHYWQHKLGDTKMEQAFPDYVATLYYKQPYDVESPEREGIILDDMSQARISGTMPAHDLVIDVYYHRIAYRLTIHYIYQDGTMAHEDYTWTYWFNSTYNVPSPIIPGFMPSIDVIAGRMPSHGLELTVVYVGDGEIVIPDEDTSLGFKSYLNAGECFE